MNMVEKLANGIVDSLRAAWEFLNKDVPEWLTKLATNIGKIIFSILSLAGKAYIGDIENFIIETSSNYPNKTGTEKFDIVYDFVKTLLPDWGESKIDTLIQNLYIKIKEAGVV